MPGPSHRLEAMDFYIGEYIQYLKDSGRFDNTVFIIASDNGPDGGNYRVSIAKVWQKAMGYHKDPNRVGDAGYFGDIGPEFAAALSSPFSFFKYYTGEGGVRTPLILSGPNIPQGVTSDAFCFVTDIVPTMLNLAGLPTPSSDEAVPITGKSLLAHLQNPEVPVYAEDEGVGLEAANSAAYFLGDYKIVKNNIPLGDQTWHLYDLKTDPGETRDLAEQEPERFQAMVAAYDAYAQDVGVIEMPEGYSAEEEVLRKSVAYILKHYGPFALISGGLAAAPRGALASASSGESMRGPMMVKAPPSVKARAFLIFCAIILVPVALGYGAQPSLSLDALFDITVDTINLTHIMRAIMGLYLGMVVIWVWGAFQQQMTAPALVSCAVFTLGLAAGRILSFILDGMPHWLLVLSAVLESVLGLSAIAIYRTDYSGGNDESP